MGIKMFLKDKLLFIILNIITCIFSAFLLYMVNARVYFILFVPCTYILGCVAIITIEYIIKNSYYKRLLDTLDSLEKKSLLCELIDKPSFYEGIMLFNILKDTNKSMNDEIGKYSLSSAEYKEYIELWVHEIKTPIAGAKLICENMQIASVNSELDRIEKLVEQALYYCRSGSVEKDYLIKQQALADIINPLLRKNSKRLIEQKISIQTDNLDLTVLTDSKWIEFALSQILDNAVKYESSKIKIYAEKTTNNVSLFIEDNGIGIPKQDLNRIFDKGFTGENGRIYAKSTGIGLYLCKKLCDKMGINIRIKSQKSVGATFELVFPKSNMYSC